jgi:integrase
MRQKMFTDPKIILNDDLSIRSYITFYYDGKRFREYNGKKLKLDINPNYSKTLTDRKRLLNRLCFEFKKSLTSGWSPYEFDNQKNISLRDALDIVLEEKLKSEYSRTYKRDLSSLHERFINFLPPSILNQYVKSLDSRYIENFLSNFKSSNRNYMNKRRSLSVFFSEMLRMGFASKNLVLGTKSLKTKSVLHQTYTKDELNSVLNFLKVEYPNLHLCCLITYGCFLRPHEEVRLLTKKHISEDFEQINLSGKENKSGRNRNVFIPNYIKIELAKRINETSDSTNNIFSLTNEPFNNDYFRTQWSRAKSIMLKRGIIKKDQTIYSFRHTAAVNVYRKTKDLDILQQLLQHSNMIVTLNYLRGLGEISDERLKDVLPEL